MGRLGDPAPRRPVVSGQLMGGHDLLRCRQIGHGQDHGIGHLQLIAEGLVFPGAGIVQPPGVEHRDDVPHLQHALESFPTQHLEQPGRVTEPRGLDDQAVGTVPMQQVDQGRLQHEGELAAQAPPGQSLDHQVVALGEHRLVDAHLAKLVDQHRPALPGGLLLDQPMDQGALAAAQETGDQVDGKIGDGSRHGADPAKP